MILLLGGTSEANPVALGLAELGYCVLASQASSVVLEVTPHPNIRRRTGMLDEQQMAELAVHEKVRAIVDVTHPYAVQVHATAQRVAQQLGIAYLRYQRPQCVAALAAGVLMASNHDEAALLAAAQGKPILLTTGSRNLSAYVRAAGAVDVPLYARVLDDASAITACRDAGINDQHIIGGRGPFTEEQNRELIRRLGAGVLVTKDGGAEGGVPQKLRAAQAEGCLMIVVSRPDEQAHDVCTSIPELLAAVVKRLELNTNDSRQVNGK